MKVYISVDTSGEQEAAKVLRDAAKRIEQGETFFELLGQNGAKYGEAIVRQGISFPRKISVKEFLEVSA